MSKTAFAALAASLLLTPAAHGMTYASKDGSIIIAAGETFISAAALPSLRADAGDRFVLSGGMIVRLRYPNGSPITRLRLVGTQQGAYVYAAANDPAPTMANLPGLPEFEAGGYRFTADTANAVVPSGVVSGPLRGVETDQGVDVSNLAIRHFTARNVGRDGMRFRNIDNGLIEDVSLTHSPVPNILGELPQGIAIYKGRNITIRRANVSGFTTVLEYDANGKIRFRNGDGIATEGLVQWLLVEDSVSSNNSDAGFDIKGSSVVLRNLTAVNNPRAYRIWSAGVVGYNLTAVDFDGAGIWLGENASITIDKFTARSSRPAPVFRWEKNATLVVKSCDLRGMAKGSVLTMTDGPGAHVMLGPTCKL